MKLHYDLHIHSCLSPCADDDMTPNNIVQMAILAGLDLMAVTDHNSCKNIPAIMKAAERAGLCAVPGMELCTAEECHVLCYFPTLDAAMAFDAMVEKKLPPVKNKPQIFGNQILMNADDAVVGEYPMILAFASSISIDETLDLTRQYGGIALPAHIDRPSFSVISTLGTIPPIGFEAMEVTANADISSLMKKHHELQAKPLLRSSDAHTLALIQDAGPWLDLPSNTPQSLIDALSGQCPCAWAR